MLLGNEQALEVLKDMIESNKEWTITFSNTELMTIHSALLNDEIIRKMALKGKVKTEDDIEITEIIADYHSDCDSIAISLRNKLNKVLVKQ